MPETGIGSQAALAVAGLPLCVYPSTWAELPLVWARCD